jgi:signal transduction histidine kinase
VGEFPPLVAVGNWRDGILSAQVFLLIVCGEALLINQIVRRQHALLDDSLHKRAMLVAYAKALDEAEDDARRAAARDLHDGVAQIIAGQGMILGALRTRIAEAPVLELVDQALDASREAQAAVRAAIVDLSPPEMEHASLKQILAWIAEFFALRHQFVVQWAVKGDPSAAAGHLRIIYRAVRELAYNAYKHSQADTVHVLVTLDTIGIQIDVTDAGVGFVPGMPPSDGRPRLGLVHLAERAAVAGGRVDVVAAAGKGCRVTVTLPRGLPAESHQAPRAATSPFVDLRR